MSYQKLQATRGADVTPSDSVNIPNVSNGINRGCVLFIGGFGDLAVETSGGDTLTFKNVPDGTFFPVHVVKVLSTGTTATDIIALW